MLGIKTVSLSSASPASLITHISSLKSKLHLTQPSICVLLATPHFTPQFYQQVPRLVLEEFGCRLVIGGVVGGILKRDDQNNDDAVLKRTFDKPAMGLSLTFIPESMVESDPFVVNSDLLNEVWVKRVGRWFVWAKRAPLHRTLP